MKINYLNKKYFTCQHSLLSACFDWIRERTNTLDIDNGFIVTIPRLSLVQEGISDNGIIVIKTRSGEVVANVTYDNFDL